MFEIQGRNEIAGENNSYVVYRSTFMVWLVEIILHNFRQRERERDRVDARYLTSLENNRIFLVLINTDCCVALQMLFYLIFLTTRN